VRPMVLHVGTAKTTIEQQNHSPCELGEIGV
jgi:hypothetical protein